MLFRSVDNGTCLHSIIAENASNSSIVKNLRSDNISTSSLAISSSHALFLGTAPDSIPRTFDALKKAGVPIFAYGNFITISINFILLAFVIFQMVKIVNKIRLQDEEPKPPPPTPEDVLLLREIRDSLKSKI